jgi:hypothetical protein
MLFDLRNTTTRHNAPYISVEFKRKGTHAMPSGTTMRRPPMTKLCRSASGRCKKLVPSGGNPST